MVSDLKSTDTSIYTKKKTYKQQDQHQLGLTEKSIVLLICRCWNAFIKGDRLTKLFVPSEMPKLLK